jgi:hypothetical protein
MDYAEVHWVSKDICHLAICRALLARDVQPVVVESGKASEEVPRKMAQHGVRYLRGMAVQVLEVAPGAIWERIRTASCQTLAPGKGILRGRLEELSHSLGIAGRVHWLGHVPTEAMACGAPVVGSRSGAIVEADIG